MSFPELCATRQSELSSRAVQEALKARRARGIFVFVCFVGFCFFLVLTLFLIVFVGFWLCFLFFWVLAVYCWVLALSFVFWVPRVGAVDGSRKLVRGHTTK